VNPLSEIKDIYLALKQTLMQSANFIVCPSVTSHVNMCIVQEEMLICDACDKGYHMNCHNPTVPEKPTGK